MSPRDLIILGSSSQQPTRYRNHGAYLFRWENEGLLFDPGEGTQRQFIFANVAPTCVTRIFISHFHGDHSLGLGSMLMRLNLDKITHPLHCYFPKSQRVYFERLRYGSIYHEHIQVIEHPIDTGGIIDMEGSFIIEAYPLHHNIEAWGYRITEKDKIRFDKDKIAALQLNDRQMKELREKGSVGDVKKEEVTFIQKGESIAIVMDTRPCAGAIKTAQDARLLLCESTYLHQELALAKKHAHLTAQQAGLIAHTSHAQELVLTHFSARYMDPTPFKEEAQSVFQGPVHLAKDLASIPLPRLPCIRSGLSNY